jgi:gluconate 2-dehydrogenase alpha chain
MTIVHDKVDVVTVGAGFTAAIVAEKLCSDGREVVSLEQGDKRWAYPEFAHNHDELRYNTRHAMMIDLARQSWTWRPNPRAPALPMRRYGMFHPGEGLGGSIVHWSAQLWRFLPVDFKFRSHHVERYGEDRLPAGSTIRDWPIGYDDLEPYYTAFDYDIGASGKAGNLDGRTFEDANIFEGPRSRPYPNPPLAVPVYADMFGRACKSLGLHPFVQPSGILSRGYRDPWGRYRAGCLYCGFCTRYGCEVDAKTSPQNTHLRAALTTGRYEVRMSSHVVRVNVGADGLATGVTYVDARGEEHEQPAELVVLSAFTLENVRQLLLSRSKRHPDGIGNDHGLVGKHYTHQLYGNPVYATFGGRPLNLFMGNTATVKVIYDFVADNFDHSKLDFIGGALAFSSAGERTPISSVQSLTAPGGKTWGSKWKEELRRNWNSFGAITVQGESLPYEDQFLDLDPTYTDHWGRPLLRITFDWHDNDRKVWRFMAARCREILRAMRPSRLFGYEPELPAFNNQDYKTTHPTGGAIMGPDPGTSVTTSYGQVWDTPNVFVTGAALFPLNPSANPSATAAAVTYRAAEAIRDRYFDSPGELL